MKVLIIGGTCHVGRFMAPKLIEAGVDTIVVGSGKTPPPKNKIWEKIKYMMCNINNPDELDMLINEAPDVVVVIPGSAYDVYHRLKVVSKHLIACGSVWMFGEPGIVPTPEETQAECLFED